MATLSAARNDALPAGQTYPPLTLTVNIALDAPANVTNTATVSGGGGRNPANNTANDPTTIAELIDLTVAGTHSGTFRQGDSGDTYTLTVSNVGLLPTSGAVSLVDALPTGLVCHKLQRLGLDHQPRHALPAARNERLGAGGSYPVLTLTVNVAANAPANVVNTATVSGGGETNTANDTASDPTVIVQVADMAIASTPTSAISSRATSATPIRLPFPTSAPADRRRSECRRFAAGGLTATNCRDGGQRTSPRSPRPAPICWRAQAYPALTLTVNVSATAPASVTNMATVSGGGELNTSNDTATDCRTTIVSIPPFIAGITPSLAGEMLSGRRQDPVISFNEVMVGAGTAARLLPLQPRARRPDRHRRQHGGFAFGRLQRDHGRLDFPSLPPAVYRLTVSDAITDTGGRELDGNGDGLPGSNYVRDFTVVALSSSLSFSSPTEQCHR